jgi:hypothetical protein
MTLCPAVLITWQIGSREASADGRQFIEPEDIFIGLTKLDEILTAENLDRLAFRRLLRGYLGLGTHPHGALDEPVHRSDSCKRVFQKAMESPARKTRRTRTRSICWLRSSNAS